MWKSNSGAQPFPDRPPAVHRRGTPHPVCPAYRGRELFSTVRSFDKFYKKLHPVWLKRQPRNVYVLVAISPRTWNTPSGMGVQRFFGELASDDRGQHPRDGTERAPLTRTNCKPERSVTVLWCNLLHQKIYIFFFFAYILVFAYRLVYLILVVKYNYICSLKFTRCLHHFHKENGWNNFSKSLRDIHALGASLFSWMPHPQGTCICFTF